MSNLEAIKSGFQRQLQYKKFVTFFWFITLFLALIPILPETSAMKSFFGNSTIVDLFYQKIFSMTNEFKNFNRATAGSYSQIRILVAALLILVSIGISGGFIFAFIHEKKSIGIALGTGFSNYKKLLGLALINLGFIILISIIFYLFFKIILLITGKDVETDYVIAFLVALVIPLILWLLKDILYDFLRISFLNNPRVKLSQAVPIALSFVSKNWLRLLVISITFHILMGLIFVVGHLLNKTVDQVSVISVFVSLILIQLIIWVRIFWRQWFWQSEIELFKASEYYVPHPQFVENE